MQNNNWARLLAYVTGLVNQGLLLQCEYLVAENRILRAHLTGKVGLSDSERRTLAKTGKRLGRKLLSEVACVAQPETIFSWSSDRPQFRRIQASLWSAKSSCESEPKKNQHYSRRCDNVIVVTERVRSYRYQRQKPPHFGYFGNSPWTPGETVAVWPSTEMDSKATGRL